jgi:hypothetical protein
MTRPRTEERIRELAARLEPVRPIPPLVALVAAALGLCLAAVAAEWAFGGLGLRVRRDDAWTDPAYLAALAGIALVAFGAFGAALASAVPGREAAARLGDRVALAGLGLGLAGALWAVAREGPQISAQQLHASLHCGLRAFGLGLGATLVGLAFLARAVPRRAALSVALALAGGSALGALVVHLTCPSSSAIHQLLGHTLAPVAAGALLALPLGALVARLSAQAR